MAGLGPRFGAGHVDVNLKFDDKSVRQVGKQIHRQLSKLSDNLAKIGDRNREVYRSIGRDSVTAWRALLGTVTAGAPLIGSAISGVAGAATLLAGSLQSAVQSAYALGPLLTSIGVAAGTAFIGTKSFFQALKSGDLSALTPSAKSAAEAVRGLSDAWQAVVDEVQERIFVGLADDIARMSTTILPVLQRGLGLMADSLNGLAQSMLDYVNSAAGMKTVDRFLANSADIFDRFAGSIVPFLDGFLRLMNALSPASKRLADRITDIAIRFQSWTQAEGFGERINDMMLRAEKTTGLLLTVLGNLGSAISNVFTVANPATNTFLQMLVDVTQRFEDWTNSVAGKNSIAEWAENSVEVMRQFGKTAEAVFEVMAELADPRVIISFLKTVEGAFEYLGKLPLDKIVDGFVKIAETLQPVSSLFLAIIIAGAALNVLIGSLIGQVGGLFSVLAKVVKFKIMINLFRGTGGAAGEAAKKSGLLSRAWQFLVRIFEKVKAAVVAVIGIFRRTGGAVDEVAGKAGRLSKAFGPVMSVLGKFARFAGGAGMVMWIGTIIAKSEMLQDKFGELWDAVGSVGSSLAGAFQDIADAFKPLAPAADSVGSGLGTVFGWAEKIMELALWVVLDTITFAFESLAKAIEGVGKIIAGFVRIVSGLLTLDFDQVLEGFQEMVSGIGPLLEGLLGLFISVFTPARFLKWGMGAIRGLGSGIAKAFPAILTAIRGFLGNILRILGRLPGRLLSLGGRAMSSLLGAIRSAIPKILAAAGRIVTGIIRWISRLPGRLFALGRQAISRLAAAVGTGVKTLGGIAARIATAVVKAIVKLPGRLAKLGKEMITKLANAVKEGVKKLGAIAGDIKDAILDEIKKLPGEMTGIAGKIIDNLAGGIKNGIGKVTGAAKGIAGAVKDVWPGSPVKDGPLTAWNRGSDASGGGYNVVEALAKGMRDMSPVKAAMRDVADMVATTVTPTIGVEPFGINRNREMSSLLKGFKVDTGSSKRSSDSVLPRKVILRIGSRDFEAYVSEVADDRIDAADSLGWQGA